MNVAADASVLAGVISPGLLYAGLGAVSLPILIHLLTRRRFRRIRWAAMEFLLDAQRKNRRRLRMEEWILLALRCLAVALLGLMLARPYLAPQSVIAGWGGLRRTDRIFLLDDSYSMAYQSARDGRTPFARAKEAVRRLVQSIRQESPEDTVSILRSSAVKEPVELQTFLDATQTEDLFQRLEALAPTQRSLEPAEVIEGAVDVLRRSPDVAGAVVYVISDFQRNDWVSLDPRARAEAGAESRDGPFAPLGAWAGEDRGLRLVLVNVGDAAASNTALTEMEAVTSQIVAGSTGRLRVTAANHSVQSLEGASLQLQIGNVPRSTQTIRSLASRQTAALEMDVEFPRVGFEMIRAELVADALPIDNVRYAAVDVANAVRTLIVNGEPAGDSYDNEVTFLATALRPEGELFSGNELVLVDESELDSVDLANFHIVILANVYQISDPAVEMLGRFVKDGGGLMIFLGDQVDVDLYNAALYRDGAGWLPAKLTEMVRPSPAVHLVVVDRLHPAMRGVGRADDPLGLGRVPFFQFVACTPHVAAVAERNDDESTKVVAPQSGNSRVIMRFDQAEEHPAVLERRIGAGRVVLFTSTADKEWNLWADHPTYLPVLMEFVHYAARPGRQNRDQWVGKPIVLPLDPAEFESDALVRTPAYPTEAEVTLQATPTEEGRGFMLQWQQTEQAGVYQFVLRRREGGEVTRLVAVNVDPAESDLTGVREEELRRAYPKLRFDYVDGVDKLKSGTGETRTEWWRWCWAAVIVVLMGEQSLAWLWGRKR